MKNFMNRYATPLTTGLFAVSAISGIALFFHLATGAFHAMHEWLSMLLLLPFALHMWKNWRPLVSYARNGALLIPLAACLVVAVPFAVTGLSGGGGNPARRAVAMMTTVPLSDLAPVMKSTPDAMMKALAQSGYAVSSAEQSLEAIAQASGKSAFDALGALVPAR